MRKEINNVTGFEIRAINVQNEDEDYFIIVDNEGYDILGEYYTYNEALKQLEFLRDE
jgi:hypothetical protein